MKDPFFSLYLSRFWHYLIIKLFRILFYLDFDYEDLSDLEIIWPWNLSDLELYLTWNLSDPETYLSWNLSDLEIFLKVNFFDSDFFLIVNFFLIKNYFLTKKRSIFLIKIIKIIKNLILKQIILSSEVFLVNFVMGFLPNNILHYLWYVFFLQCILHLC